MKVSESYPSNYLKASDFPDDAVCVIEKIEVETVGQGAKAQDKPVIYFRGMEKGLVCNKTNANTIANLYGDEMDDWRGKAIMLYATEVQFMDEMTLAIRVRMKKPALAAALPTTQPGDIRSELNAAWAEFGIANQGKTKDEIKQLWLAAIKSYFNKPGPSLSAQDWIAFRKNKFVKPAEAPPFAEGDAGVPPDEIPF